MLSVDVTVVVVTVLVFGAAEPDVQIGYVVTANGSVMTVANHSTVLHIAMEDVVGGNTGGLYFRLWCNGFAAAGGWEMCRWYRPGGLSCRHLAGDPPTVCDNNPAGDFTSWRVQQLADGRCEVVMTGASRRDTGDWSCFLLANSSSSPLYGTVTMRRRPVAGNVTIITAPMAPVEPGSTVQLECQVTAWAATAPRVRWIRWPSDGGGPSQAAGNITQSGHNTTEQGDPVWFITNRLIFKAAVGPTERLVCRAELADDFRQQTLILLSKEVVITTDGGGSSGGGGSGNSRLADWEIGLAVGLSLLLVFLLLLLVFLLCWCWGLGCFRHRRRRRGIARKKKLQVSLTWPWDRLKDFKKGKPYEFESISLCFV
jgi:hypothetical protein